MYSKKSKVGRPADAVSVTDKVLLSRADLPAFGINFGRQYIHELVRLGRFPAPIAFGPGRFARKFWRRADIVAYVSKMTPVKGTPKKSNEAA